jgi:glucokinase
MKKYAIGIDLGGTSVKYALIDNEGVFHFQGKLPSKADVSAEAVIGQLVTACKEAMASALQLGVAVEGIGIGTPGIVDETNRIVLGGAENIKGWENLNLADRIEAETGLPVQMGNDANLMGLGETMYGAGQGAQNVVFLTVGTGIGGAVVIGGKQFNITDEQDVVTIEGYASKMYQDGNPVTDLDQEMVSTANFRLEAKRLLLFHNLGEPVGNLTLEHRPEI